MNLVWKLLRQHISIPQFCGFAFANLCGMAIVLLGVQFYSDVLPIFTASDSFMKADYIMVSKRIGTTNTISGASTSFSASDMDELKSQTFVKKLCAFSAINYHANAHMGISGQQLLNSELTFESVPDDFVDIKSADWHWTEGEKVVPVIIPRTYVSLYNFGIARSKSLPQISDGLMGMIDIQLSLRGNGHEDEYKGKVVALSNSISTVLVPQSFMDWSNNYYAPGEPSHPNRLLVEVDNPADKTIQTYFDDHALEMESDKLNSEKTTYFLRLVVSLVMVVGIIISVLSFYILMLSIYLLVQKNASKLENLLLIGYSPAQVARPYQMLTIGLNALVLIVAIAVITLVRTYYIDIIESLYPDIDDTTILPTICVGMMLFVLVTILNSLIIRRKIMLIWQRKE